MSLEQMRIYSEHEKAVDQLQCEIVKLKRMLMGYRTPEDYKRARNFLDNEIKAATDRVSAAIEGAINDY
jgi:hypothetical protein